MSPGWRESSAEHRVPDLGRGAALSAQAAERELVLSNSMLELNASDRDGRVVEDLEAEHRAGLMVFLELIKHIQAGRTELRMPAQFATQLTTVAGFAQVQGPDFLLREDRLERDLAFVCDHVGIEMKPLPPNAEHSPYPLAAIYGPDLEKAARDAYGKDYAAYGFANWSA